MIGMHTARKILTGTLKIRTIQNLIRKTVLSELTFCPCGYFAKEIFINLLIHAGMLRRFMKIALALNSYILNHESYNYKLTALMYCSIFNIIC